MSKNTSFSLGDHFNSFVQDQVAQGRYDNASDVIRAGLRLLEEQEARLAALRAALVEASRVAHPYRLTLTPLSPENDMQIRGYYRYPAGSHILFYRLTDAGVDLVRILHQRMDVEQHL